MFDPRDPYERCYWHYDSRKPLSIAQLIGLGSVDAKTAALIWLMLEDGVSFIVAGPTDPRPGIGKTTVLNALFQLLPAQATLAYTSGMYEDFAFTQLPDLNPATTYVLANEISDHQPFYMWGRVARRYLLLPAQGYRIASSVHADTISDVHTAGNAVALSREQQVASRHTSPHVERLVIADLVSEHVSCCRVQVGQLCEGEILVHARCISERCLRRQKLKEGVQNRRFPDARSGIGGASDDKRHTSFEHQPDQCRRLCINAAQADKLCDRERFPRIVVPVAAFIRIAWIKHNENSFLRLSPPS